MRKLKTMFLSAVALACGSVAYYMASDYLEEKVVERIVEVEVPVFVPFSETAPNVDPSVHIMTFKVGGKQWDERVELKDGVPIDR